MDAQQKSSLPQKIPHATVVGDKPAERLPKAYVVPRHSGMGLGDIYYILFRQKWKIILCSAAGILVAGALFVLKPPPYQSEAKLLIRYITDSTTSTGVDSTVRSPDERGENIINTEVEILTSFDLAEQIVDKIGPEKIVDGSPGAKDRDKAA